MGQPGARRLVRRQAPALIESRSPAVNGEKRRRVLRLPRFFDVKDAPGLEKLLDLPSAVQAGQPAKLLGFGLLARFFWVTHTSPLVLQTHLSRLEWDNDGFGSSKSAEGALVAFPGNVV
jgi:hypothetical protein